MRGCLLYTTSHKGHYKIKSLPELRAFTNKLYCYFYFFPPTCINSFKFSLMSDNYCPVFHLGSSLEPVVFQGAGATD